MKAKLYTGNAIDILKRFPDQSINCCVTSPPYFGLRDYGTGRWEGGDVRCNHVEQVQTLNKNFNERWGGSAGQRKQENTKIVQYKDVCGKCGAIRVDEQIGLEQTPDEYVAKLVDVFREVKRVLRNDGLLWVNIGDCYTSGGRSRYAAGDEIKNSRIQKGLRAWNNQDGNIRPPTPFGLKPKDLIGIPWMLAFALRNDGWYLRCDNVWEKPNCMPDLTKDRPTRSHESVFMLSKSAKYYYDYDAVKVPSVTFEDRPHGIVRDREYGYDSKQKKMGRHKNIVGQISDRGVTCTTEGLNLKTQEEKTKEYRNLRSVWTINTKPFKGEHYAVFPPSLPEICIKASCSADGVVLDPFSGSGMTGVVALGLGKNYVGIDLNGEYNHRSKKRLGLFYDDNFYKY